MVSHTARAPFAATLPAIAAALLPKCPLCLAAILSSIGVELPLLNTPLFLPLAAILLSISLGLILRAAHRNRRPAGAWLACAAAPLLVAQRAFAMPSTIGHAAVLLLVGAVLLTAQPAARCSDH